MNITVAHPCICVFYTKQRKVIKILDGEKSIAKELLSTLPNVFYVIYMFICFMFFFYIMLMYFMQTEAKLFNLYYSSVPILKNSMKLKLQGLQKRD